MQINKFVELLVHTGEVDALVTASTDPPAPTAAAAAGGSGAAGGAAGRRPLRLLDCGCGSAHLTFGAYHYLANVRGARVALTGVDSNAALMARSNRRAPGRGAGGRGPWGWGRMGLA